MFVFHDARIRNRSGRVIHHRILLILVDGEMLCFKSDATIFQGRIVARSVIQINRSRVKQKVIGGAHVLCIGRVQLDCDIRMVQ